MRVVTPIAIYAVLVCKAGDMDKRSYRTGIDAVYRSFAFRAISAFRSVSTDAAVVIAGIMHLKLVVDIERRNAAMRGTDLLNPVQIAEGAMDKWQ